MSRIVLAVISITFLMFPFLEAQHCFSEGHCCNLSELRHFEKKVNSQMSDTQSVASPNECRAISEGPKNIRSTSPWKLVEDIDSTRYPQRLLQAQCGCPRSCISLSSCVHHGGQRNYTKQAWNGVSVPVAFKTLVFYRRPCPTKDHLYYLETALYTVNVSCTCVAARNASCNMRQ